jgi:ABC-type nitrate/sulfonate/bicarbonate transport system substrate-binding protein
MSASFLLGPVARNGMSRIEIFPRRHSWVKRLLLAFTFALLGWTQAALEDKVVLLLDWLTTWEHAAYFAGLQCGFFRDAGDRTA